MENLKQAFKVIGDKIMDPETSYEELEMLRQEFILIDVVLRQKQNAKLFRAA